jgi:hypothetical protein
LVDEELVFVVFESLFVGRVEWVDVEESAVVDSALLEVAEGFPSISGSDSCPHHSQCQFTLEVVWGCSDSSLKKDHLPAAD